MRRGASDRPHDRKTSTGEVRGVIDAHSHPFSNEGFGGGLFCGATFSTAGIADALKDCPTITPTAEALSWRMSPRAPTRSPRTTPSATRPSPTGPRTTR